MYEIDCLTAARSQGFASVFAISKLLTDLERIGDHATNIADIVLEIGGEPLIKPLIDFQRMTELAQSG